MQIKPSDKSQQQEQSQNFPPLVTISQTPYPEMFQKRDRMLSAVYKRIFTTHLHQTISHSPVTEPLVGDI